MKLTQDKRGWFRRDLGWKLSTSGKRIQHRFTLGSDPTEAQIRALRLERLWGTVPGGLWTEETLAQAKAIARGTEAPVRTRARQSLHSALDAYAQAMRDQYRLPGHSCPTRFGCVLLARIETLKEHSTDMPLSAFGLDQIEAMLAHWKNRPMTKRGTMAAPDTCRNMIKVIRHFVRWLHRSAAFSWHKPDDYEVLPITVPLTPAEVSARCTPHRLPTFTVEQIGILYRHASALERLWILLALNCNFGLDQLKMLQLPEIVGNWIKRTRFKSHVYGEWKLWGMTARALAGYLDCRPRSASPFVFLGDDGTPINEPTSQGNDKRTIPNRWAALLERVKREHHDFPLLSFNKLKKTGAKLLREVGASGEVIGVIQCRGTPVKSDPLQDRYAPRAFEEAARFTDLVGAMLEPILAADALAR